MQDGVIDLRNLQNVAIRIDNNDYEEVMNDLENLGFKWRSGRTIPQSMYSDNISFMRYIDRNGWVYIFICGNDADRFPCVLSYGDTLYNSRLIDKQELYNILYGCTYSYTEIIDIDNMTEVLI